jgi:AcrR family transcriptional regulator
MTKTRDRIIETAITLFNEKGTKGVSTNHIANACGISPGNLYYHFRNKEDIIRAIFEQMDRVGMEEYQRVLERHQAGTLEAMASTFVMIQEYNWRYRFFKRELTPLIMNDPLLRDRFQKTNRSMLAVVRNSVESAIALGLIKPLAEREIELFSEEIWLVALFWLNYLELNGEEVNGDSLKRGSELLRNVILPHLTDAVQAAMKEVERKL